MIVKELLLLETSQAGGLNQRERLMHLYFATDLCGQAQNETSQEEGRRQADDLVCQVLELRQVFRYCSLLS